MDLNPVALRARFPALTHTDQVYLDSAATTQKPDSVIDATTDYLRSRTANTGRGTYPWATARTAQLTDIRSATAAFIGASHPDEVVFTSGATAGLNAVAIAWGLAELQDGDEILISSDEHAALIFPWYQLRSTLARFGRRLHLVPYRRTRTGAADLADIAAKATARTRLIALSHLHHVYGALTPIEDLRQRVDSRILLCVDCSQSAAHLPIDVTALGADFAVFAGHKMFGVPGTGVLYCHRRVHAQLTAFLPGGTSGVHLGDTGLVSDGMPELLEGGTPNIPGILALGAAMDFLEAVGRPAIAAYTQALTDQLIAGLRGAPQLRFLPGPAWAPPGQGHSIVSFSLAGISATDLGFVLSEAGFMVRTGAHCVPAAIAALPADAGSVRVSMQIYNTPPEIDRFTDHVMILAKELR